jgi:hypothetical protein
MTSKDYAAAMVVTEEREGRWWVLLHMGITNEWGAMPPNTWQDLNDFATEEEARQFAGRVARVVEHVVRFGISAAGHGTLVATDHPAFRARILRFYGRNCACCSFWASADGKRGECLAAAGEVPEPIAVAVTLGGAPARFLTPAHFKCEQFQARGEPLDPWKDGQEGSE